MCKSFAMFQETTLGSLAKTHEPDEKYAQRFRRRKAFQAGIRAGFVILVPGGVSQAAAYDGDFDQIPAGNHAPIPPHRVLPI